ncbi:glutaredoxin family protein [Candidatus Saccharibacteria bacterium]|nr:glutaredoxin family protein [Candidatus Saccharibacteria bacterium]
MPSPIKIYTTRTCAFCHAEMDWLEKLGIDYEEIDAESLDIKSVPLTKIGSSKIIGFDRPAIKKALKKEGIL